MSSLLTNLTAIQQLAKDLVRGKQLNYSEQCIPYYVEDSKFILENIQELRNISGHLLKATLIRHKDFSTNKNAQETVCGQKNSVQWTSSQMNINNKTAINEKCIIFLHGLGSSRLQAMPLVEMLPPEYCLFAFDFSGSGKSEGQNITYGIREAEDIEIILDFLKQNKGIKQFIIWGRSMGAVAAILFASSLYEKAHESISASALLNRVKGLVIDSPFGDFQEITKQIALKRVSIPEFLIQIALKVVNQSFQTILKDQSRGGKVYNPFTINLASGQPIHTGIPTIFIYSLHDQVVDKAHCQAIIKNYKSRFDKVIMEDVSHNQARPEKYLKQVFELLQVFDKKMERDRRRNSIVNSRDRILTRNNSMNLDTEGEGYGRRRGISVSSKEKARNRNQIEIQMKMTQQSFHELNLKKTRIQQYNSHKIQPKKCIIPSEQSPTSRRPSHRKNSPLRLKLSNSLNKKAQTNTKPSRIIFQQQPLQISTQQQSFYNTISYDNTDILHRKLYKDNPNGEQKEATLAKQRILQSKMGCGRGRRQNQAQRKLQYQLNHTRYL